VSFAVTAPVAAAIGPRATLVGAALLGAAVTLGAYFLPGMTDVEREPTSVAPVLPTRNASTAPLH